MAQLQAKGLKDASVRKAFQDAMSGDRITETEMKRIIKSVNDGNIISRNELQDLRRILVDSTKMTNRASRMLEDFVVRAYRLAGGTGNLEVLPTIHRSAFDSHLTKPLSGSRIWKLTIEARVFLDAVNDPDICTDRGADRSCVPWPNGEIDQFKRDLVRQSQFWSDRFFLKPPAGLKSLEVKNRSDPPYVACKFNLMLVPSNARRHRRIRAVYLDPADESEMRSRSRLYDNKDVRVREMQRGGRTYKRVTVWHELGHLIGLKHIGVVKGYHQCGIGSDTNARACYGGNHRDRRDALGIGTAISKLHADPWVFAAAEHTFTEFFGWEVVVNSRTRDKYTLDR